MSEQKSSNMSYTLKLVVLFIGTVLLASSGIIFAINTFQNRNIITESTDRDDASLSKGSGVIPRVYAKEGDQVPFIELKHLDGTVTTSEDLKGKNVMLVFWATWCTWCAQEQPHLQRFVEQYKDDIRVIAVDRQEPKSVVESYVKRVKLNFDIVLDEDLAVSSKFGVTATPFHIYINKRGKIVNIVPGYETPQDLEASFRELIESN